MTSATVPWAESCRTLFTNCSKAEAIISWVQSGGNFHCFSFKRQKQLRPDWDRGPHSRHWHETIARKCNQNRLQRVFARIDDFIKGTVAMFAIPFRFVFTTWAYTVLVLTLNILLLCINIVQRFATRKYVIFIDTPNSLRKSSDDRNWRPVYRFFYKDAL